MSNNIISVKAIYYSKNNRQCYIDGPWAADMSEAVKLFASTVKKKGSILIFRPFFTHKVNKAKAHAKDNRGNYYQEMRDPEDIKKLSTLLKENEVRFYK